MSVPPGNKERMRAGNVQLVQDLFEIQQFQTPDATAVYFEGNELTYSALNERADELAQHILIHSSTSSLIGISTTRSIEMIVGVLAILKAGKAYLPLDPVYPEDRLQQMISDSGIQLCVVSEPEFPIISGPGNRHSLIGPGWWNGYG